MSKPLPQTRNHHLTLPIRSGVGRILFLWFLGLTLIPLGLVSWRGYTQAVEALHAEAIQKLSTAVELKSIGMESFFSERIKHLQTLALSRSNIQFLHDLQTAWQAESISSAEFVKSFAWSLLIEEKGRDLKEFIETYEYNNLLILEPDGAVLFAVHPDNLLGSNLLSGPINDLKLRDAVRRALNKKKIIFSDLSRTHSKVAISHLIAPMIAENGNTVGIILLQFTLDPLYKLLENHTGFGNTGEVYLLGRDLLMRSNSRFQKTSSVLEVKVDTKIAHQWMLVAQAQDMIETQQNYKKSHHNIHVMSDRYIDYDGHEVLGIFTDLEFMDQLDTEWGMIAELEAAEFFAPSIHLRNQIIIAFILTSLLVLLVAGGVTRHIVTPLQRLTLLVRRIQAGELTKEVIRAPNNEVGALITAFQEMTDNLMINNENNQKNLWIKQGSATLNERLRGEKELTELANQIVVFLTSFLHAHAGAFYTSKPKGGVMLCGSCALSMETRSQSLSFAPGEGMIGQVLLSKTAVRIHPLPEGYFRIQSGLGNREPRHLLIFPFLLDEQVIAIIELGSFEPFTDLYLEFLNQESKNIAMAVAANHSRTLLRHALEHAQEQTQALEKATAAMKRSNEELQEQSKALQTSEALLQQQQEELRVSNEELEAHAQMLEEKNVADQRKNEALQAISQELAQKARDLEQASRYKSEFLSNMSHELRTPLNSLLILANSFANNEDGNLTSQQVEEAQVIYNSGNDLLGLINEILDLAKIEAGRMDLHVEEQNIQDFAKDMERNFRHVADKKGVAFELHFSDQSIPESLRSDWEKAARIIKNLLANAFKFTSQGRVTLGFAPLPESWQPENSSADRLENGIAIFIEDTGIGIPDEKLPVIFEAFRQADGSTSRQFGGTGLGLTISTQLAQLLNGAIQVTSTAGVGSRFTLLLPELPKGSAPPLPAPSQTTKSCFALPPQATTTAKPITPQAIKDDRDEIVAGDRVMLIIEDDNNFAHIVAQFAHTHGFKYLAAADGKSGIELATLYKPTGIILDLGLPILDGWHVLEQLKENPVTRHIPVHIMSAADMGIDGLSKGAASQYAKPVSKANILEAFTKTDRITDKKANTLLLVDGDPSSRAATIALLEGNDIQITQAESGHEALRLINEQPFDCLVMELALPDMNGLDLLDRLSASKSTTPPTVIYSRKKLTDAELDQLKPHTATIFDQPTPPRESLLLAVEQARAQGIVIKGVQSPERLLDEVALFMHRVECDLPPEKRQMIQKLHDPQEVFKNKTILVVDDDMRNAYALAQQLKRKAFNIRLAVNGEKALAALEQFTDIDCVLMDIMMPIMDGYEAIKRIRQQPKLQNLPIIALTAKAMEEDRQHCMRAGANDYLAKPVDMNKLFAMLRIWLYR